MTETKAQIRLATTAIVAALAMSSTPLLAQDATPDTAVETPVSATADPLTPAPTADTGIVPTTVAPEAAPTASEAAPTRSPRAEAPRRAATTATRPSARPAPASVGTVDTPAPAVAAAEPVLAIPATEAAIAPAPPVAVEPAASRQMQTNAFLMIAGAVLLGLVALAAAAFAIRRRRRRAAEVEDAEWQAEEVAGADAELAMVVEPEPLPAMVVEPEPVPVRTGPTYIAAAAPAAAMAPAAEASREVEGPITELPEDFDLSKFGHNVQEAYKGPTEDNPSLSLKNRLRRASGMDTMERNMDAEVEAATGESVLDEADATSPAEAPAKNPTETH